MVFKLTILLAAIVATTLAFPSFEEPTVAPKTEDDGVASVSRFVRECGDQGITMCFKMRALNFMDSVLKEGNMDIIDGVTLLQSSSVSSKSGRALTQAELESSLSANEEERDNQVETLLLDRVARFLQSHTLQIKVPDDTISEMRRSIEEGRKKKKKLLLPLLLALKLKAAALIPLILGGLALLALKALVVGKIALVLSALIGLQKLLGGHQTKTVEVVSHPHYDHHEHSSYGRAIQDGQKLAYAAYAPQ